ncbi:MAG: diguanylate cyclase [Rhodospirillaceae bacterium]|jgi:two-component system, cell cycle response regulator|nr:diguanylate cyclase [Rhodospirillaceae bacterium]MBT5660028.1 diguanylate cyclase [Rhodospirillaceae bacterium]MBT5752026.1 diguanylate cyclase [Rhodospirillaceae bacterium]
MTQYTARVLILGSDSAQTQTLAKFFRQKGFHSSCDDYAVAFDTITDDHNPDLVLMLTSSDWHGASDLFEMLKDEQKTSRIPIVVQAENPEASFRRRCFAFHIDDLVTGKPSNELLFARTWPLVRLSTMYEELRLRALTAKEFGLDVNDRPDLSREARNYRVMIAGVEGEELGVFKNALASGYEVTRITDPMVAHKKLGAGKYDAFVMAVNDDGKMALKLCANIRNNPRLFNLPVLLITDPATFPNQMVAYNSGASNILTRPLSHDDLQIGILTLVMRQKARWDLRESLLETMQKATLDARSGLYSNQFFDAHMIRRTSESVRWNKFLSLGRFRIENLEGIAEQYSQDEADNVFKKFSDGVVAMLRGEDLPGLHGDNEIAVLLPETSIEHAQNVARRIHSTLSKHEFKLNPQDADSKMINIQMQSGVAALRTDDSGQSFFARAEKDFATPKS